MGRKINGQKTPFLVQWGHLFLRWISYQNKKLWTL